LYIEGKLNYRKKQDGTSITEIVAKSIRVLSKRINGSDNEPIFFADDMDVE
jgi:hypothetical protein